MPYHETLGRLEQTVPLLGLREAPKPRQVAEPLPDPEPETGAGLRMTLEILGNVLGGSAWLAALLAAPAVLGRLFGLI
jgi:hypothetical protein